MLSIMSVFLRFFLPNTPNYIRDLETHAKATHSHGGIALIACILRFGFIPTQAHSVTFAFSGYLEKSRAEEILLSFERQEPPGP
jgi:hypothetical protein